MKNGRSTLRAGWIAGVGVTALAIASCDGGQGGSTSSTGSGGASSSTGSGSGSSTGSGGASSTTGSGGASSTTGSGGASASSSSGTGGSGGSMLCTPGEIAACYGGPVGTEGIGVCKAGTKTCAADGSAFGPCVGEVLPQAEICGSPGDEDCDGLPGCPTGDVIWAKQAGGPGYQAGYSIATDAAGNVFVANYFQGAMDLDGSVLQSAGGYDAFVAKLDPAGNHLWSKRFGGAWDQFVYALAVDAAGDVILGGDFEGSLNLGGSTFAASADVGDLFVAKLDPAGNHLWSRDFEGPQAEHLGALRVDGAGNVFLAGDFMSSVSFGGAPLTSTTAAFNDGFVVKLDPAGNHLWSKGFGGPQHDWLDRLAVDPAGNVIVTGTFAGTIDFGGGPLQSAALHDAFVAKLDPSGAHVWSKRFGGADPLVGYGITADAAGNVIVTGQLEGPMDFGGGPIQGGGGPDVFVLKLNAAGAHVWSRSLGDALKQVGYGVATDAAGNVLVTGEFDGTLNPGSGPLVSSGDADLFLIKFAP